MKPNRYTKNDVEKDIRNNFTLEQEKQMYGRYSFSGFFLYIIAVCAFIAISYFVFGNELISINNIAALGSTVLFSIIAKISTSGKLDKQFSIVSEKIKKESEGR